MFCKCLCRLLRAVLSGFYPLGVKGSHASGVFLYGSPWKAHRATVRNSDGCMRLWENAVDRSGGGKMLPPWSVRKTDGPPNIISPHKWSKRNLLFFEKVPNAPGKTFAVFSALYSFLSNGQFCPLPYTAKHSRVGIFVTHTCIARLPTRTFGNGLEFYCIKKTTGSAGGSKKL